MKKTISRPHDNWGKIQRESLKYLKGNDLRVYADLLTYANDKGKCWPSVETISKDLGISSRNVQKHLANLERDGWIEKHLRTNTSTIYQLYFVKTSKDSIKVKKIKSRSAPKNKIGVSKSDVTGTSKNDISEVSKNDVSGVSESDVLTDHLTDQYNKPQEQAIVDCFNNEKSNHGDTYDCTDEERSKFDDLWSQHSVQGENEGSAYSAWRKYCAYNDPVLLNMIQLDLEQKFKSGSYMTTLMKFAYQDYCRVKEKQENARKLTERNAKNPEQQL